MNSKKLTIREAMIHASEMIKKSDKPDCYYWSAIWWRLHSKESKNPSDAMVYSRNQMALFRDMQERPGHYIDPLRPLGISDWQWSGISGKL